MCFDPKTGGWECPECGSVWDAETEVCDNILCEDGCRDDVYDYEEWKEGAAEGIRLESLKPGVLSECNGTGQRIVRDDGLKVHYERCPQCKGRGCE